MADGKPVAENIKAAEDAVKQIGPSLESGAELVKKSRDYAGYEPRPGRRSEGHQVTAGVD